MGDFLFEQFARVDVSAVRVAGPVRLFRVRVRMFHDECGRAPEELRKEQDVRRILGSVGATRNRSTHESTSTACKTPARKARAIIAEENPAF